MTKLINAPEVETYVLGSFLLDNSSLEDVYEFLPDDVFSDVRHKLIYSSIRGLYDDGIKIDTITLYDRLKKENSIEDAGGIKYLSKLSNCIASSANIGDHAKILVEKWMLRKISKAADDLKQKVEQEQDPFEILDFANTSIYEIENHLDSLTPDKTMWSEFTKLMDLVEKKASGELPAGLMSSSFPSLNSATGGIMNTDLVVVYGKDKSGKTSFSERLILDFAFQGIPIGVFPMEIDFETYAYKAYSMEADIGYLKLRNPRGQKLEAREFQEFYKRAMKFEKTKIYVDDVLFDFDRMTAKARQWKRKYKIGLFVFDYLGLIQSKAKFERRDLQLASYTGRLKNLAKELNTPIIVVSQANEDKKTADGKGAMRDGDFSIYLCKPTEDNIKSIKNKENEEYVFKENEFLCTIERSRHGRAKQNFVCGFVHNNFKEITIDKINNDEPFI